MARIPRDEAFDSTLALFLDPYKFISKKCQRYQSDLFQTRLMLHPTICMTGPEAAELFYDEDRFMRHGATPGRIQDTLFGRGGVQSLDGMAHRHRKQMFMSLMTPDHIGHLEDLFTDWWDTYVQKWAAMDQVILYHEVREILTRAVCAWSGVPLEESDVGRRTADLTAMFDYAGSVGPKHWWSRLARNRAERWIADIIRQVRAGQLNPTEQSPAHVIAWYRDLNGDLLSPHIASVELLNVLRPTVAVSVYIIFVAHALHQHPECRMKLQAREDGYPELFVQEVRRFYPFFPSVMALVRHDFDWKGYRFPQGASVVLDLYGTNHDARTWDAPDEFRPERFRHWDRSPFNFIPQGGGDYYLNHRCAGEWITIELMKVVLGLLAGRIVYNVPQQDLSIDISRLPALPRSHFAINNVRTGR